MTDPDAPPAFDRRTVRRFAAGVAVLAAVVVPAGGWVWVKSADRRRAEALFQAVHAEGTAAGRRLTDAEFDEALALTASPDRMTRHRAVFAAAVRRHEPPHPPSDRGERVEAVILRLLDSADPEDQTDGLHALWLANRPNQAERARAFLTSPHPEVRKAAAGALKYFGLPQDPGAGDARP